MTRILLAMALAVVVASCSNKEEHTYELVYNVYYTETPVRVTKRFQGNNATYVLGSDRGSNYLYINKKGRWHSGEKVEGTSAPIQVLSFREVY